MKNNGKGIKYAHKNYFDRGKKGVNCHKIYLNE